MSLGETLASFPNGVGYAAQCCMLLSQLLGAVADFRGPRPPFLNECSYPYHVKTAETGEFFWNRVLQRLRIHFWAHIKPQIFFAQAFAISSRETPLTSSAGDARKISHSWVRWLTLCSFVWCPYLEIETRNKVFMSMPCSFHVEFLKTESRRRLTCSQSQKRCKCLIKRHSSIAHRYL